VSDDEAFYFNKAIEAGIVHTGLKARNLQEFLDFLQEVDFECIKHHMRYNVNDFRDWAGNIICDNKLAGKYDKLKKNNMSWTDEMLKRKMLDATQHRLGELYKIVYPQVSELL